MKVSKKIESIDDVEFELIQSGKMKESNNYNYVNNKELYQEFIKYHEKKLKSFNDYVAKLDKKYNVKESLEELDEDDYIAYSEELRDFKNPRLSDKIGAAIIQIANRRCNSRQYVGYSNNWKEEMISNAIMTATIRCHNFDPEKSNNPFAYLTQICDNAIKEQIKKEKRQLYVKYKSIEEANGFQGDVDDNNLNESDLHRQLEGLPSDQRRKFIDEYETTHFSKKKDKVIQDEGIERFF